jgi:hypothetical protein
MYHHNRDSIEAHLRIVFVALGANHRTPNWLEHKEIRPHRSSLSNRENPRRAVRVD